MPILTWQNIPVGDLSGMQEGIRTASTMLERAVQAGQSGANSFQQIDDNQRAFAQQTADKVLAAKMMAIQDPNQYRQAMASGTLADPAIAQAASLDAMLRANKQLDVLQNRAQADQTLATGKQTLSDLVYQSNRSQLLNKQNDAIAPLITNYSDLAVKDPKAAMAAFEADMAKQGLAVDASTAQAVAKGFHDLYIKPDAELARLGAARRKDEEDTNFRRKVDGLFMKLNFGTGKSDIRQRQKLQEALDTNEKARGTKAYDPDMDSVVYAAMQRMEARHEDYRKGASGYNADLGMGPGNTTNYSGYNRLNDLDKIISNSDQNLSVGARVAKTAREDYAGMDMAKAAQKLTEDFTGILGKEPNGAEIEDRINWLIKESGGKLNPGQAAAILINNVEKDDWWNWADFSQDTNGKFGRMLDMAKNFPASKMELEDLDKSIQIRDRAREAFKDFQKAKSDMDTAEELGYKDDVEKARKRMNDLKGDLDSLLLQGDEHVKSLKTSSQIAKNTEAAAAEERAKKKNPKGSAQGKYSGPIQLHKDPSIGTAREWASGGSDQDRPVASVDQIQSQQKLGAELASAGNDPVMYRQLLMRGIAPDFSQQPPQMSSPAVAQNDEESDAPEAAPASTDRQVIANPNLMPVARLPKLDENKSQKVVGKGKGKGRDKDTKPRT